MNDETQKPIPNNVYALRDTDPLPPGQVLRMAEARHMTGVLVVGWLKDPDPEDGRRFYFSSSFGDPAHVLYALEHAKRCLMNITAGRIDDGDSNGPPAA